MLKHAFVALALCASTAKVDDCGRIIHGVGDGGLPCNDVEDLLNEVGRECEGALWAGVNLHCHNQYIENQWGEPACLDAFDSHYVCMRDSFPQPEELCVSGLLSWEPDCDAGYPAGCFRRWQEFLNTAR